MPEQGKSGKQPPREIVIVGAGRVGMAVARLLEPSTDYSTCLVAPNYDQVRAARSAGFNAVEASGADERAMEKLLRNAEAVILAAPESVAVRVAEFALMFDCHYFDLCENVEIAKKIKGLSQGASRAFVSQCGLAPGYVSALTYEISQHARKGAELTAYVGVLPKTKTNRLGFGSMWDIAGLVTEYTKPCKALRDGALVSLPPLTEYETLEIDGEAYEAFTTAGSLDGIILDVDEGISELVFKTIRYRGHLDYINFLLDDLGFKDRLYAFPSLLKNGLKSVSEDKALVSIKAVNPQADGAVTTIHTQVFHSKTERDGSITNAISLVSAAHICSVLDVICSGAIPCAGPVSQQRLTLGTLAKSCFSSDLRLDTL